MKLQQAVWILNLSEKDDFDTAKKKYRKLMGTFHPDAVDRDQVKWLCLRLTLATR